MDAEHTTLQIWHTDGAHACGSAFGQNQQDCPEHRSPAADTSHARLLHWFSLQPQIRKHRAGSAPATGRRVRSPQAAPLTEPQTSQQTSYLHGGLAGIHRHEQDAEGAS